MMHLHHLRLAARPAAPARLRVACAFALLLLAGCATAPPATIEVKVPVYVKCVTAAPVRPAFEVLALPPGASDGEKVLAIARDMPRHFKYEGHLEAAVAGCL